MNREIRPVVIGALIVLALPLCLRAAVIYVDAANAGDPGMDGSAAHPWDTISKGAQNLAEVNDVSPGGHTVSVAAGAYAETVSLTNGHSGVVGSTNMFLGTDFPTLDGGNSCFDLNNVQHVAIRGFHGYNWSAHPGGFYMHDGTSDILMEDCIVDTCGNYGVSFAGLAGERCVVRDCLIFRCHRYAIHHYGRQHVTVENCTIYGSRGVGVAVVSSSLMTIRNCIIFGSGSYGLWIGSAAQVTASNLCMFANGAYNVYYQAEDDVYDSTSELLALSSYPDLLFTNTIVANPGFSDLSAGNYNEFYTNSPCLPANSGFNEVLGRYKTPATVPVSSNTYYVDAAIGDDGRSSFEARNSGTPWETIRKAASVAVAGDTVIVKPGTYDEEIAVTNGGSGDLRVTYVADGDVIVDCTTNLYGFTLSGVGGVDIRGFEFQGPAGWGRGCMDLAGCFDCTLRDCEAYDNDGGYTCGGVRLSLSPRNVLENLMLYEGKTGIYIAGGGGGNRIDRCSIYSNSWAGIYSAAADGSMFMNDALYANATNILIFGASGYYTQQLKVENCVLSDGEEAGIRADGGNSVVVNTVIQNSPVGITEDGASDEASPSYCCFYNNTVNYFDEGGVARNSAAEINAADGCSNNIVTAPGFVDEANRNYRLSDGSACIDAGSPTADSAVDMFGNPRLEGPAVDIGVYEMPPPGSVLMFN